MCSSASEPSVTAIAREPESMQPYLPSGSAARGPGKSPAVFFCFVLCRVVYRFFELECFLHLLCGVWSCRIEEQCSCDLILRFSRKLGELGFCSVSFMWRSRRQATSEAWSPRVVTLVRSSGALAS